MITYKKEIEKPRLEIEYDEYSSSPREWSTLGYFITVDRNHHSPDRDEQLESIVSRTGDRANNQKHHIELIKKEVSEETEHEPLLVVPISKYEHSGISYSVGSNFGFDHSNNGFYIVTKERADMLGVDEKDFLDCIKSEVETYNTWVSGEIFCFNLYNDKGVLIDSCTGFYDIQDIMEHLPEEFRSEDLKEYLIEK